MFPNFGATDTLSKASTMVFRIGTDAHLYDDPDDANIASLLDSKFDSEKCEALKRLLALIAQGLDVSNFFPQVVKNVATQSLEVKKLVYVYLLHYAEKRPNEALLSINYFQKDLGDPNPLVRAWALRAMAGIRLHVIAPLVLVAIRKCARDPSVYVRKCAAYALPKLNDLQLEENMFAIEEIVGLLLNDCSPGVVGAAASVFASICPNNFSLIGRNYKRLCEILPDVEEWGQIVLTGILLRFIIAKHGLVKESLMFSLHNSEINSSEGDELDSKLELNEDAGCASTNNISELAKLICQCYIERPDEYLSRSSCPIRISPEMNPDQFTTSSNEDVKILLRCTSPLLWSHNSAVVLAAAGVHWIVASRHDIKRIVKPLLFVLRSSKTSKYVVLCNIQVFAKAMPSLFAPHFEDFFISSSDSYQTKALKLDILSSIATESAIPFVLKEFQDYIKDPDRRFAADTIAAIGLCAQRLPKLATTCLEGLLTLIRQDILFTDVSSMHGEAGVLVQAIVTIKSIIKLDPPQHEKVIVHLPRSLDSIKVPAARAIVIWMVGEYSSLGYVLPRMLTTILKYLAWCFPSEALEAKLQILNMVTKVLLRTKGEDRLTIKMVLTYMLELAEYDMNYDVRDRARVLKILLSSYLGSPELNDGSSALLNEDLSYAVAEVLFVGQRRASKLSGEPMNDRFYLPGSLSQIVLHAAPGYEALPKPCSVPLDDLTHPDGAVNSDLNKDGDPDSLSGSSDEENASAYSSQQSYSGSSVSGSADGVGSATDNEKNTDPLIQIADVGSGGENRNDMPQSGSADLGDLVSRRALESWLDEEPDCKASTFQVSQARSTARITIGDIRIKIKHYLLLDPANGSGLKVDYSFSSEASIISPHLVCIEVLFENCSSEPMSDVFIVNEDSTKDPDCGDQTSITESSSKLYSDAQNVVSMEPILCLQPGERVNRMLQVHFHHHLLPLKLVLFCNGKKFPVKIRPDIGYFVKPLPMDLEAFRQRESFLRGMFEYTRSCTFTDHLRELNKDNSSLTKDQFLVICQSLAQKMLSNGNLFLVSVDMPVINNLDDASGLCLRFSSEIMSNTSPCLITLTVEGKCSDPLNVSVKVNCEETVFGLNLLNRIVSFLIESSSSQS